MKPHWDLGQKTHRILPILFVLRSFVLFMCRFSLSLHVSTVLNLSINRCRSADKSVFLSSIFRISSSKRVRSFFNLSVSFRMPLTLERNCKNEIGTRNTITKLCIHPKWPNTYSALRPCNFVVSMPMLSIWRPEISLHIDDRSPVYFETDIEKRWLAKYRRKFVHLPIGFTQRVQQTERAFTYVWKIMKFLWEVLHSNCIAVGCQLAPHVYDTDGTENLKSESAHQQGPTYTRGIHIFCSLLKRNNNKINIV